MGNVPSEDQRGRAIIIGGSMTGLLTARAAADHFREVMVIERDDLSQTSDHRRGVPQGRHTHVLLASGRAVLESLFPGISSEFAAAGAIRGDTTNDVRWFVEGARVGRFVSGLEGIGMSRALLERTVRSRVRSLGNVAFRHNLGVDGVAVTSDKRRILGVKTGPEILSADLILDASGRGSRTPRWLEEIGYQRPKEEQVGIDLRYTTRLFRRHNRDLDGDNAAVILPTPVQKRGGVMVSQENDLWIVTLMTQFGDFAPSPLDAFIEFTRTLADPCIFDVIRKAEPIGEPRTIRIPSSVRHRYEHLKRFPAGLLVVGDALSSFNPVYGQGMSVAALEAAQLGLVLGEGPRDLARRFFRRAAKIVDGAWAVAAGNDLRMIEATGRRDAVVRFTNAYVPKLIRAGHHDNSAALAFFKVSNLLAPPRSLLHPSLLWQAMRAPSVTNNMASARGRARRQP